MQSQGRVHESEWRGEQETARRGERKITSNPRTNEGRSTTSEGISKAPIRRLFKHHPSWEKNIKIWPSRKTLSLDWFDWKVNWIITRAITFSWNKQEVTAKLNKFWSSCFFQARRQLLWDLTLPEIISSYSQKLSFPVKKYHHNLPHLGFYTHALTKDIWFQICVSYHVGSWTHPLPGVNPPCPRFSASPHLLRFHATPWKAQETTKHRLKITSLKVLVLQIVKSRYMYIKMCWSSKSRGQQTMALDQTGPTTFLLNRTFTECSHPHSSACCPCCLLMTELSSCDRDLQSLWSLQYLLLALYGNC